MSKDALLKHLMTNGGRKFSKSSANKAIKQFQLIIEREFWLLAFDSMMKYEKTGVMLHLLGLGVRRVFFRLCYVVGDNPALNRFCGIYEGNALKSCIKCLYSMKKDGLFDPTKKIVRNARLTFEHQGIGEEGYKRWLMGGAYTEEEKLSMKWLRDRCVQSIRNATCDVPMGFLNANIRNHILHSPCDILHTFECGIFKNVILWTLTIISNISKSNKYYEFSQYVLDSRIARNRFLCKLSNVTTTYFRKGITFIQSNKTSSEKAQTTGGAGGFRSCEFVSMLIQMFFSVSY